MDVMLFLREWVRPGLLVDVVAFFIIGLFFRQERKRLEELIGEMKRSLEDDISEVQDNLDAVAPPAVPIAVEENPTSLAEAEESGENWKRIWTTWREARDWIELLIEQIPDGRERGKYKKMRRRNYEPIMTMLRNDRRISAEAAADLIALNEIYLRLRRTRAATKAIADDFVERYERATKSYPETSATGWANEDELRRFYTDATWNDLTGNATDDPVQRAKLADRFAVLMKRPDAQELIDCFALYVARCVPFPFRTAYSRWVISMPAGRRGNIANLSVGMQWAAVCYASNEGPLFQFYGNGPILKRAYGRKLERLSPAACDAVEATDVVAGGTDQLKLVCYPREVTQLLGREEVVKALRHVSMAVIKREPLHRQHHCFDLADAVLAKARSMG